MSAKSSRFMSSKPVFCRLLVGLLVVWIVMGSPAWAEDDIDLEGQAIRLLHPNYLPPAEAPNQIATVDHNVFLIGQPAFEIWNPATKLRLNTAPLGPATLYVLALAERSQQEGNLAFSIELGLFALQKGHLTLVCAGTIDDPQLVIEQGYLGGVELDLKPYKISDDETAFGVRIESAYDSSSEHVVGENLYLIRPTDDGLIPIFNAPVSEDEESDIIEKEGPKSIVTMQHHKTLGFYNIRLRSGLSSTKFVWSGSYYENPESLNEYGDQN